MLPKSHRLPRSQFPLVKQKGKPIHTPLFTALVLSHSQSVKGSRFGFIVSSKISKKAVVRNRLKRQLRQAIRLNLPSLTKNCDIIILAKKTLLQTDFSHLVKTIRQHLANQTKTNQKQK